MASDKDIDVRFGGGLGEVLGKVTEAQGAVTGAVEGMNAALATLGNTFGTVLKALELIVATLAGGAVFKKFIDDTNELNLETIRMASALGISGEQASIMGVALRSVGLTTEEYTSVQQRFARNLRASEQRMRDIGLHTRHGSGHLRDQATLFNEAIGIVGEHKQGIDRNVASMGLFGSRIGDVNK